MFMYCNRPFIAVIAFMLTHYCRTISASLFITFVSLFLFFHVFIAVTYADQVSSEVSPLDYFNKVKGAVFSDEYSALPQYKVTKKHFDRDHHNLLFADAKRTLESSDDLIEFPAGQKLLQANGICFSGKWVMNEQSDF